MKTVGTPPTTAFVGPVAVKANTPEPVFVQVPVTAPVTVQVWPITVAQPIPGVPDTAGVGGAPVVGVAVRVGVEVMVGVAVGATMLIVTAELGAPPIIAWLVAVLGVVAVVLTRKFRMACELVQVTWPTKPGAGFGVTAPQPSPFWKTRPADHWSVNVEDPWAFATTTRKLTTDPGVSVAVVPPPAQFVGVGQMVFVIVVVAWSSTLNGNRGPAPSSAGLMTELLMLTELLAVS
jgi:hypothetical protein